MRSRCHQFVWFLCVWGEQNIYTSPDCSSPQNKGGSETRSVKKEEKDKKNDTRVKFRSAVNLGWACIKTIGEKKDVHHWKWNLKKRCMCIFPVLALTCWCLSFSIPQICVSLLPQRPEGFAELSLTHGQCKTALNPMSQELLLLLTQVRT